MTTITDKPTGRRTPARESFTSGLWAIDARRVTTFAGGELAIGGPPAKPPPPPAASAKPYDTTTEGVALIDVCGPMMKAPTFWDALFGPVASTVDIGHTIRMAAADRDVSALVLVIESPGGQVAGTAELADTVAAARARKPVVAFAEDVCCSAAYWVAAQTDRIIVNAAGFVGSIGTYAVLADTTGLQNAAGVKFTTVAAGEWKGLGADGAVSEKLVADVQREVDGVNALFTAAVAAGRKMTADRVATLADGRAWIGADAVSHGLADSVGTLADAVAAAAARAAGPRLTPALTSPSAPTAGRPATVARVRPAATPTPTPTPIPKPDRAAEAATDADRRRIVAAAYAQAEREWDAGNRYARSFSHREAYMAERGPELIRTAGPALLAGQPTTQTERTDTMSATTTRPTRMTADEAKAAAGREYDADPTIRAAFVDRATFVASRWQSLVDGTAKPIGSR